MVILIRVHEMLYIVRMRLACSDYKIKDFGGIHILCCFIIKVHTAYPWLQNLIAQIIFIVWKH